MRLEEIQAFLSTIQYGSITAASQHLHMTQPALSQQIVNLENELGTELIIRKKGLRQVQLTDAGKKFIPRAEKFIRFFEETKEALHEPAKDTIRFSCVQSLFPLIAYQVSTGMSQFENSCDFTMRSLNSKDAKKALQQGHLDLALVCSDLEGMETSLSSSEVLFSEDLKFFCGKDSLYPDSVDITSLSPDKELFVFWSKEFHDWHNTVFQNSTPPFIRMEHAPMIKEFFADADFWAIMPVTLANSMRDSFRTCEINSKPPRRQSYLIHRNTCKEQYIREIEGDILKCVQDIPGVRIYPGANAV